MNSVKPLLGEREEGEGGGEEQGTRGCGDEGCTSKRLQGGAVAMGVLLSWHAQSTKVYRKTEGARVEGEWPEAAGADWLE